MAEVLPFRALHYDPDAVEIGDVVAPPYDVIDAAQRAELVGRSPYNVVELDLPESDGGSDIYEHAAEKLNAWEEEKVLIRDDGPSIWALEQEYSTPEGEQRTRRGFLAKIRVTDYGPGRIRPHERTQPGPKEDRLRLTRATRHNLSPIFVLHQGEAWSRLEPAIAGEAPFAEVTDADGTLHRVWKISDAGVHERLQQALADSELLIADGHHRYETARTYAEEIGGDGEHRYTLAALVSLEDPGLSVFATHRLLHDLAGDAKKQEAIRDTLREHFDVTEVTLETLVPAADEGPAAFGYIDAHHKTPWRLTLKDTASLDEAPGLADRSEPYRRLDAAALETLVLGGALGMSTDDIAAKRGLSYCSDTEEAIDRVIRGDADAAFILRPTPVGQVREVAAEGENMPPKSTFFFPKLLTGIAFNPLR